MTKLCRHCKTRAASKPRGLCWTCYLDADVRPLYGKLTPECAQCGLSLDHDPRRRRGELCSLCRGDSGKYAPEVAALLREVTALVRSGRVGPGPTDARPGSVRKVAVMCVRAALKLPVFHPDDSPGLGPGPGGW
jgi:hypothetical protein